MNRITKSYVLMIAAVLWTPCSCGAEKQAEQRDTNAEIVVKDKEIRIRAGVLARTVSTDGDDLSTTDISVAGRQILANPGSEFFVRFQFAAPNREPIGLTPEEAGAIVSRTGFHKTEAPSADGKQLKDQKSVRWIDPIVVRSSSWANHFKIVGAKVSRPGDSRKRLTIISRARQDSPLDGVSVEVIYDAYQDYPVIRKSVRITNSGRRWLKVDQLMIDDITLADRWRNATPLTPAERGASSSIVALGTADRAVGVIAVSEVPSALRANYVNGSMGYTPVLFEWVIGPSERFSSEPVFQFAYHGEVQKTISGVSTPLDRAVERPFKAFIARHVGLASSSGPVYSPLWASWSNFGPKVDDRIIRRQADIAVRCGFVAFQIDDGWQQDRLGTEAHAEKFPDFDATCRYVRDKGLKLGLWVSCFRTPDSPDFKALPEAACLPIRHRLSGVGMSFASSWRDYYTEDMVRLAKRYGASYFKQDFSNIQHGDIAKGHESRTRAESLLRGLRGLLAAQDAIRRELPALNAEISHEIYWGTPGVPCDIAALKHASLFHIPPNDYSGAGPTKMAFDANAKAWNLDPQKTRDQLVRGCFNARQRFFAHRGLPLQCIEYYSAATVNIRGSLTPQVQDRQVCSWLMGIPSVFAGDLTSLSEENIVRYRDLFDIVKRLQRDYDIYRYFQYSGVPEPTDTDWHWWGKLNDNGYGAVVVLRGSDGEQQRSINTPWAVAGHKYRVVGLIGGREYGIFTAEQLRAGAMCVRLPRVGQEILELAKE
jgi:alpha-galactosidase